MLTGADRAALLALARGTIIAAVTRRLPEPTADALHDMPGAGVFVTIRHRGVLRGCLGTLSGEVRVTREVVRCARDAATVDRRFAPVAPGELDDLEIEISILGALEAIAPRPDAFTIGLHGLLVEHEERHGLLLPQVAVEWGWTAEQFLRQTTVKAGLAPDAWQRGARLFRFAAEVFGD